MSEQLLVAEQHIARPVADTVAFFADARNLEAITPPWLGFRVLNPEPIHMHAGARIAYRLRLHGVPIRWLTEIEAWEPGVRFVDRQVSGPYALWHHTHEFSDDGEGGTLMRDRVRYAIGFGLLGRLALRLFVRRDVEAIFRYRAERIADLLGPSTAGPGADGPAPGPAGAPGGGPP